MKKHKIIAFLLALLMLLPNIGTIGYAAENAGIAVTLSSETVEAGEQVTVTVSLTGYDADAVPIRGIQIDVTGVDDSILAVEDGSYVSLIEDASATSNKAVYQQANQLLRLIYVRMDGTLAQPYEDVFQMTFVINSALTEAGSITLPLTAKIQTTESRVTITDEITISYVPASEGPDPEVVSVDIKWGGMSFTYTEGTWSTETHSYDGAGWTDNGTGYVTISNTGTIDTTATFVFASNREEISGSFTNGTNDIVGSVDIAAGQSQTAYLLLSGKPTEELSNTKIGTATVKIGGE